VTEFRHQAPMEFQRVEIPLDQLRPSVRARAAQPAAALRCLPDHPPAGAALEIRHRRPAQCRLPGRTAAPRAWWRSGL